MTSPHDEPGDILTVWQDPPATYRGKPFWSWNGRLDKDELLRQARVFAEMGMGGFFMHSRTGLVTEYLGDEWFDLINACSDEAKRLGLEAWLYDEDRWPSGSAGGLATQERQYRMKLLRCTVFAPDAVQWPPDTGFVAAFSGCVDGINVTDVRRVSRDETVPVGAGRSVLVFTTETTPEDSFYNGNTYLDTLSRGATEHFLRVTHDQYQACCDGRLGGDIRGIFTDEPHHGTVMCDHNDQQRSRQAKWATPWTETLFARFEVTFGYDLRDRLPELFLRLDGRRISPVKWHYMELIQAMFLDQWAEPLHTWCKEHGMLLTGHVLHEDSLAAQAVPCGSMMRYYEHMDYPGVDVLALNNENFWLVKQLASVGRQLGKPWLLSELYGCTGWQTNFTDHKRIGDWQALFGINIRCHHLSWYTMAGEAKRDYPASISFQSRWYKEYAAVEDYFSRLHVLLQAGTAACDVLVINPVESTWAQIHAGWAKWLGSNSPDIDQLERQYAEIFRWLTSAQIDFDYGDEDHLQRWARVDEHPLGGGPVLRLGKCDYRVVVVAGMETIRASTLEILKNFAAARGQVIFAGGPPAHVNAEPSDEATQFAATRGVPWYGAEITAAVRGASRAARVVRCDTPGILCQVRQDGPRWIVVALNPSSEADHAGIRFQFTAPDPVAGSWNVEQWDCFSGARSLMAGARTAEGVIWNADFPPLAERAFVLTTQTNAHLPVVTHFVTGESRTLHGPFPYTLDEPNLCVLDFAAWQFADGPWEPEMEILKIDEAIRARAGLEPRGGTMVQPWARPPETRSFGTVRLRFSFDVAKVPPNAVELLVETPSAFRICVNGATLAATNGWFIDPCLRRVPITAGTLHTGRNQVELEAEMTSGLDLEAIFLAGSFGVTLAGRHATLGPLPETLSVGDVGTQGLPFYSGKLTYHLSTEIDPSETRPARLTLDPVGCATLKLKNVDGLETMLPWGPFEADLALLGGNPGLLDCEMYLTRRNTFGPLHEVPKEQAACGPTSFRTRGDKFSENYQLFPCGLASAPTVSFGRR